MGLVYAWGGGTPACYSQATIDKMKALGFSEFHYVSPDLEPRPEIAAICLKNGIYPVYDLEYEVWARRGFVASNLYDLQAKMAALKGAGWKAVSSEGLMGFMVDQIKAYTGLKYINYGGENADNMFNMYYSHVKGQHNANYMECYHEYAYQAYMDMAELYYAETPNEMGLTWMMYTTASLELNVAKMMQFMSDCEKQKGIKWKAVLFWAGLDSCGATFGSGSAPPGTFNPLYEKTMAVYGGQIRKDIGVDETVATEEIHTSPAFVETDDGVLHIFCVGLDQALWYKPEKGDWVNLGGKLTSGLDTAKTKDGFVVGGRGTDEAVWYRRFTKGVWSGWITAGGRAY